MATAKLSFLHSPLARKLLAGAAVLALLALAAAWPRVHGMAVVASSYGAKVGCACRYIGGRSLNDCRKDFEAGMGPVWLSEDAQSHTITARYGLIAPQRANFSTESGCVAQAWKD